MFLLVAKGSSFLVEVQVGGRVKSSEVVASWCWEDPDATALEAMSLPGLLR